MNIIDIEHIAKIYQVGSEEVFALRDTSLKIDKNEYVAIMGPSGSGKSTLMNILGCLDTPTSGKYDFNGVSVSQMNDNQLAKIRNKEIFWQDRTRSIMSSFPLSTQVLHPTKERKEPNKLWLMSGSPIECTINLMNYPVVSAKGLLVPVPLLHAPQLFLPMNLLETWIQRPAKKL
jgi:ABC-type dipeptide/oligopeptide/nickel transport system ATPase subunit